MPPPPTVAVDAASFHDLLSLPSVPSPEGECEVDGSDGSDGEGNDAVRVGVSVFGSTNL